MYSHMIYDSLTSAKHLIHTLVGLESAISLTLGGARAESSLVWGEELVLQRFGLFASSEIMSIFVY